MIYNDYGFEFNGTQNDFSIGLKSGIKDLNAKTDFDFYASPEHKLKFGGQYTFHTFLPSVVSGKQDTTVFAPANVQKKYANEFAIYIQDDWEISRAIKLNYGVRYSRFQQVGRYTSYTTDADGNKLDSTTYGPGQVIKSYGGFEPRLTVRYSLNDESSIKAAVTKNYQYIHL